ncbi:unnamed protein product [Calicophoron daubneyi]|uniref:Uncharacterized protein n=1 Tax=Calicophoron daubneyi TaxID=300641 RepID=A0AAV2TEN3_CALDB
MRMGGIHASPERLNEKKGEKRSWLESVRHIKLIWPYIWPKRSVSIQLRVVACFALLFVGRVVNVYSPVLYKRVVDSLSIRPDQTNGLQLSLNASEAHIGPFRLAYRWDLLVQFIALRFVQGLGGGPGGLIGCVKTQLWLGVDQYSSRELSILLFAHLQDLSLRWHLSRKTGEVLRVMDRGTSSVSELLNLMVFDVIPIAMDICFGVIYFTTAFNIWYGLIIVITMVIYTTITTVVTNWRTKFRRKMNNMDNARGTKAVDALLNFETVKYFNAEQFETDRFRAAYVDYQKAEWQTIIAWNLLNFVQSTTVCMSFLVGSMLCARDVVRGTLTVGDFVLFNSYSMQLYGPLGRLGMLYRRIQRSFVDMENMFDLIHENSDVRDAVNAHAIVVKGGEVEFRNVHFGYNPERVILRDVSFKIPAGHTVALVGESGSGKSTIVRLLFRFYDVDKGEILVDDQDIRSVTQSSLRLSIGVVPQDTVLFNDTVEYNIRYGRRIASDEELRSAALAADIHDRILEFPEGYKTVVGERGLKLSGGEKQRIAIARNVLKNPRIMLLDEATSALDTATERNVQASLNKIAQNRTTLVVAHRLSTIVHADEILVMHRGEIVERGTHEQLLAQPDGRYATLWREQCSVSGSQIHS